MTDHACGDPTHGEPDTTQPQTETTEETWAYAGRRLLRSGRRVHAWVTDSGGGDLLLFAGREAHAIGSLYQATVSRDGQRVTLHGAPTFLDPGGLDTDLVTGWQAAHHIAQTRHAGLRRERQAAQRDELAVLLTPLRRLVHSRTTRADRAALVGHILSELTRP